MEKYADAYQTEKDKHNNLLVQSRVKKEIEKLWFFIWHQSMSHIPSVKNVNSSIEHGQCYIFNPHGDVPQYEHLRER